MRSTHFEVEHEMKREREKEGMREERMVSPFSRAVAAATTTARGPQSPGRAAPLPNLVRAGKVRGWVARCRSRRARVPVDVVDLVQANIVAAVVVVVFSIRVASGFCIGNAPATVLRPVAVV